MSCLAASVTQPSPKLSHASAVTGRAHVPGRLAHEPVEGRHRRGREIRGWAGAVDVDVRHRAAPEIIRERKVFRWNVPASGWQQWKANHGAKLPAWFLRRWPVRFVEHVHTGEVAVRLDRFWTFPESTVRMPELGQPVRLMQWSPSVEWIEGDRS